MSLVGNLEDLGLGEILQIVSLSRKSGVLAIHSAGQVANVVFRQGQVVKAGSSARPVLLDELLVSRQIVDPTGVESARCLQEDGGYRQRLGDILVAQGMVEGAVLEELVREQIEQIVYSLFVWHEGTFDFELQENLDVVDDSRTDQLQFQLTQGLNAQFLAMEGSLRLDEQLHERESGGDGEGPEPDEAEENVDFAFDLLLEPSVDDSIRTVPVLPKRYMVIVDDDQGTLAAMAAHFGENGYEVISCDKGEDALIAIDTLFRAGWQPTLVIDLIMPRMDGSGLLGGLELLELLHDNFPQLPTIVLADHGTGDAERRVRELGYGLMGKPSKTDIVAPAICSAFCERLGRKVTLAEEGEPPGPADTVNISDELRMEMGEEGVPTVPQVQSTGISLLRGMLEELNDPALGGGIILLVLRFASEFMARAVIFVVKENEIAGLGQFGIEDRELPADVLVRAMRIPRGEESVFSRVVESQLPVKLHLDDSRWSGYLREQLGGNPAEVFLGPIISEGKVVALLYGDNGDEHRPIGDTDSLEIFLSQAGITMEKVLLQRRLKDKSPEGM
ncbi:MAG: response regulator [Geobacter sp.]|nr:response regulator [Geobacter sp.]